MSRGRSEQALPPLKRGGRLAIALFPPSVVLLHFALGTHQGSSSVKMAKQLLAETQLAAILPNHTLVSVTTGAPSGGSAERAACEREPPSPRFPLCLGLAWPLWDGVAQRCSAAKRLAEIRALAPPPPPVAAA